MKNHSLFWLFGITFTFWLIFFTASGLFPSSVRALCDNSCVRISGYSCSPANLCGNCLGCTPRNPGEDITNPTLPGNLTGLSGSEFLQKFLNLGVTLALIVGSLFFFFTLLLGGIRWISSSGDKTQIEGAHKQITNALIGLAILLGTFAIIGLIEFLFGINIIKFTLPTL